MLKEDKKIIGSMIKVSEKGLKRAIGQSEEGLRKEIKSTEEGLRKEMSEIEKRIREDLGKEIRHNGFLMERMEESICQIAEGQEFIRTSLDQVNAKLNYHRVERVDTLWETVKDHSKRIKKLETAKAN